MIISKGFRACILLLPMIKSIMENMIETTGEKVEGKTTHAPRTKEVQDSINHLILGISMWFSVTITCITTLIAVHQPWCLVALLLPFIYTMFPQIQKFSAARLEVNLCKAKLIEAKEDTEKSREVMPV